MRSFATELVLKEFRQAGFNAKFSHNKFIISDFKPYVERHLLKAEGKPVQGKRDTYYHNYVYPHGLMPAFQQIKVDRDPSSKRIQALSLPEGLIKTDELETILFKAKYVYGISGVTANSQNANLVIHLGGHTDAHKVLGEFIDQLVPPMAPSDPETNYVSDLGQLAPFIVTYLKNQAKLFLCGNPANLDLLQLKDGDQYRTIDLQLEAAIIIDYINKKCREEQLLVSMLDKQLRICSMPNFIATDVDGLDRNLQKIQAIKASGMPCYIASTTGGHAFSMKIDFEQNTIFVANPAGPCEHFDEIIQRIKTETNINHVTWVNTLPLNRTGSIDISDTCTADALVLVDMMANFEAPLSEACLNRVPLRTGEYAWAALDQAASAGLSTVKAEEKTVSSGYGYSSVAAGGGVKDEFASDLIRITNRYEYFIASTREAQDRLIPQQVSRSLEVWLNCDLGIISLNDILSKYPERKAEVDAHLNHLYQDSIGRVDTHQVVVQFLQEKLALNTKTSTKSESQPPAQSITKENLQACLNAYRPNSFVGVILWIVTFGAHRSETVKALDALCQRKAEGASISLDEMMNEISQETVVDSCKQHRINLFFRDEEPNQSGTDQVISSILWQLQ